MHVECVAWTGMMPCTVYSRVGIIVSAHGTYQGEFFLDTLYTLYIYLNSIDYLHTYQHAYLLCYVYLCDVASCTVWRPSIA